MTDKNKLKYILAQIQRDIELNRLKHAETKESDFHIKKVYADKDVEIEWKREVAEA